jgi:hypothetical protein
MSDGEVVSILAKRTTDAALRARLHDILWEQRKDYNAGTEAAACYTQAAERLDDLTPAPTSTISHRTH